MFWFAKQNPLSEFSYPGGRSPPSYPSNFENAGMIQVSSLLLLHGQSCSAVAVFVVISFVCKMVASLARFRINMLKIWGFCELCSMCKKHGNELPNSSAPFGINVRDVNLACLRVGLKIQSHKKIL
jgi:hypothetical protein